MTTLSSLIVARHAASIAQVDEALARQVVRGGDLPTSLLELGVIGEATLVPLLAETYGVEAAGVGELAVAAPSVLRLVPPAVALRYGLYPLEERDGELCVAVAEPLPQAIEDDLGFALGARLHLYVALMMRIRQAIARDYGLPLDRRFLRLLARLEHRPDPSPSERPPRRDATAVDPMPVRKSKSGTLIVESAVPPQAPAPSDRAPVHDVVLPEHRVTAPAPRRNTWPGMPSSPAGTQPKLPAIPRPAPKSSKPPEQISSRAPTSPAPSPDAITAPPVSSEVERRSAAPPPEGFIAEAAAATALKVEKKRRWRAEHGSGRVLAGWARKALGNTIPTDRGPERRRGPLTAAAAEQQLEEAHTGEQALATFFGFARQYFEYSALFSVHGDLAAGHDSWGSGASREKVRAIGVALDLPSALSQARSRATPTLVKLKRAGLDADLRTDLARSAMHEVLVLPIVMRGRCVALLYADDGEQPVEYGEVAEVIAIGSLLAAALERILLRKKRAALRDASAVKSKLENDVDRSNVATERPGDSSESVGPLTSPPADLSELVAKGGKWSEEDMVDQGWTLPSDDDVLLRRGPPPPAQVAAVRPLSKKPIAREDDEPPPVLTISEIRDATPEDSLLEDLEQHPSPAPGSVRAASTPEEARRSLDPRASSSVAAAPHPPPPSRAPFRELPSVLIRSELVDQVVAGGERGEKALGEILALGEAAIPSVFARFPGLLTVDRNQALGELPRPADCGPVLRIVAAMRRLALPFLAVRSADGDVEVRFWATYLLGELNYADAAIAVFPRMFDENPAVRRIALRAARALVATGEEGAPLRKGLERMIGYADEPLQRRLVALSTIGELRLYRSIPALIRALSDPADAVAEASVRALVAMTRQEFGRDRAKWNEWWESKGKKRLT